MLTERRTGGHLEFLADDSGGDGAVDVPHEGDDLTLFQQALGVGLCSLELFHQPTAV